jgi:4-amino-4-deoxy-L-arabinose transferase-like glycosyltransferase
MKKKLIEFVKSNRIFILILVLGFVLRFYKLQERMLWGGEQSLSIWPIARLFEEKQLTLIGVHLFNYKSALFRPPFFIYLFALPLKMFHFNPFAIEIIFALIGVGVICLIYFSTKKIFDKQTAVLASFFYSISNYLIKTDKTIWTITPIIITSAAITFFFAKILNSRRKKLYLFLLGVLTGLGFSFHFQIAVPMIVLCILILKKGGVKNIVFFLSGLLLLLSPLIIFNLRHNFIMLSGLKNLLWGNEVIVRQNGGFGSRVNNALDAFLDLWLQTAKDSLVSQHLFVSILLFFLFFILPALYVWSKSKKHVEKTFILYFLLSCLVGLIGLAIINQGFYSSTAFYLWFLIPIFLAIWGRFLSLLYKKNVLIAVAIISLFIFLNISAFVKQTPGNYQQQITIVNYILKKAAGKNFNLKFINNEALAYDYLFYYRAPFYSSNYNKINFIEQWQRGNPNFFIIQGDYNWQQDKYSVLPYKKIENFETTAVIIKSNL